MQISLPVADIRLTRSLQLFLKTWKSPHLRLRRDYTADLRTETIELNGYFEKKKVHHIRESRETYREELSIYFSYLKTIDISYTICFIGRIFNYMHVRWIFIIVHLFSGHKNLNLWQNNIYPVFWCVLGLYPLSFNYLSCVLTLSCLKTHE